MSKRLCFVYTETNGLHQSKNSDEVNKKKLYCYARLV